MLWILYLIEHCGWLFDNATPNVPSHVIALLHPVAHIVRAVC